MATSYERDGERLLRVKGEVDFSTDAILVSAESGLEVTVRDAFGSSGEFEMRQEPDATRIVVLAGQDTLTTQDSVRVRETVDWSVVQSIVGDQRREQRAKPVVDADQAPER